MPRSRILGVSGDASAPVPRSRALRVTGVGTLAATPRSRVLRVTGAGATSLVLNPLTSLTGVEPETLLTITASAVGGVVPDSWTWRKVSGNDVGIVGTGATINVRAPSGLTGASTVIGVTATKDGVTSVERQMTITALPQIKWLWTGTSWQPRVTAWL